MKKAAPCEAAFAELAADEGARAPDQTFQSPR